LTLRATATRARRKVIASSTLSLGVAKVLKADITVEEQRGLTPLRRVIEG
jgi:hypothetical protein